MDLCGDEEMAALLAAIGRGDGEEVAAVDRLLARFPEDARLHFMRGSILAGRRQALEAHASLVRAVELAPEFHIARYQLGFFELTSGEVDKALSSWGPLLRLPDDAYLRLFVEGLTHLVRDEFEQAAATMRRGIALNRENEPLNNDIRLLIAECQKAAGHPEAGPPEERGEDSGDSDGKDEAALSATSVILGQFPRDPSRR